MVTGGLDRAVFDSSQLVYIVSFTTDKVAGLARMRYADARHMMALVGMRH